MQLVEQNYLIPLAKSIGLTGSTLSEMSGDSVTSQMQFAIGVLTDPLLFPIVGSSDGNVQLTAANIHALIDLFVLICEQIQRSRAIEILKSCHSKWQLLRSSSAPAKTVATGGSGGVSDESELSLTSDRALVVSIHEEITRHSLGPAVADLFRFAFQPTDQHREILPILRIIVADSMTTIDPRYVLVFTNDHDSIKRLKANTSIWTHMPGDCFQYRINKLPDRDKLALLQPNRQPVISGILEAVDLAATLWAAHYRTQLA